MIVTELIALKTEFIKKKTHTVRPRKFHSLTYRVSGSISIENNGQSIYSGPGCITFVPKGVSYDTEIIDSGIMLVIHFSASQEYDKLKPIVLPTNHPKAFESLFQMLIERYRPGLEKDYTCMGVLYQILSRFDREYRSLFEPAIPLRMINAKKYIDQFFDHVISIESLAQDAGISQTFFRKEFKQYYGISPLSYLKKTRIENAKIDLQSGYYSVSEVASRCGFDSISYFSAEFHRYTGLTPKEYQNNF